MYPAIYICVLNVYIYKPHIPSHSSQSKSASTIHVDSIVTSLLCANLIPRFLQVTYHLVLVLFVFISGKVYIPLLCLIFTCSVVMGIISNCLNIEAICNYRDGLCGHLHDMLYTCERARDRGQYRFWSSTVSHIMWKWKHVNRCWIRLMSHLSLA